jgi:deltex
MSITWVPQDCSGSPGVGSIGIYYSFPGGTQGKRMDTPGTSFAGTNRYCYYPNTPEGLQMLELLKKAFLAGLLFTVGQSVTTGQKHMVIWGGIHQKTSLQGGPARHGWPDTQRLAIMTAECKQRGIELLPPT